MSIFMRLTARPLPTTMPSMATMIAMGCLKAKTMGFMEVARLAAQLQQAGAAGQEKADQPGEDDFEDANDQGGHAEAAIQRIARRQRARREHDRGDGSAETGDVHAHEPVDHDPRAVDILFMPIFEIERIPEDRHHHEQRQRDASENKADHAGTARRHARLAAAELVLIVVVADLASARAPWQTKHDASSPRLRLEGL